MNKIAVIAKNKGTNFIKRLIEEVGEVSVFDPWSDIDFPEAHLYLARTTGVYKSDLDLMLMKALPRLSNPWEVLKRFRSKVTQYQWLEQNDFPILPWVSLRDVDDLTAEKFTVLYPKVVVKPHLGQGGWGVEVLTRDTLKPWIKKHDRDYLLQPLVKDATEFRYFFIKGSSPIVLERKALSGIAANFQKEGGAVLGQLPPAFVPEIERLIKLSGAHYGAIDLFIDQDRLIILELNAVPGIEQLESVSGINVMKQLAAAWELSD